MNGEPSRRLLDSVLKIAERHLRGRSLPEAGRFQLGDYVVAVASDKTALWDYIDPHFPHSADEDSSPDLSIAATVDPAGLSEIEAALSEHAAPPDDRSIVIVAGALRASLHVGSGRRLLRLDAFETGTGRAAYVAADQEAARHVDGVRPLLQILRWWSATTPVVLAHAAAFGTSERGILLVGRENTGKSSTSLAATGGSLFFLADDVVMIGPGPRLGSVFSSARLRSDMMASFSARANWFPSDWQDWKGMPSQAFSGPALDHVIASVPLSAIVILRSATGSMPGFKRAARAHALRTLAPTTLAVQGGETERTFDKLASLLSGVPTFEFQLTRDLDGLRADFEAFVEKLGSDD